MKRTILLRATVAVLLAIAVGTPGSGQRRQDLPSSVANPRSTSSSAAIEPFRIHVPDTVLADLKDRLVRARPPEELDGSGWKYGANRAYLTDLITYWRERFDWRGQERRLNQFEQFKTNIDGIGVHPD